MVAAFREIVGVRRRPQPHVPIERSRWRLGLRMAEAWREAGFPQADGMDLTDGARLNHLNNTMVVIGGVDLRTKLKYPVMLFQMFQHHLPFADIIREGFFSIHILTRLKRHGG